MNPVLAQPLAEDSPGDSELWTRFCYVRTRDKFCLETTPRTVFISYLHTENLSDLLQPQRMCCCKISNTAASCPFVFLNRKWVNSANRERGGGGAHGETSPRGAHALGGSVRNACNGGARPAANAPKPLAADSACRIWRRTRVWAHAGPGRVRHNLARHGRPTEPRCVCL